VEGTVSRVIQLMRRWRLGRRRVLDTVLAATLESAGVSRLATFNVDDFSVFGFLEVVSPTNPAKP
jgi:predicted nucleic acid-binding protein